MTSPRCRDVRTAVVVDGSTSWLSSVEPIIAVAQVQLAAATTDTRVALDLVRDLRPSLLLTGLHLARGADGLDLVRRALELCDDVKVIVVSSSEDVADVAAAFEAGACAYVVRSAAPGDLSAAIRTALAGTVYIARSPSVGGRLAPVVALEPLSKLTPREREVLALVAEGHTNAELARMLWVTEQTVKFHLSNVYRKVEVSNRTEASRWAQRAGLLGPAGTTSVAA